MSVEAGVRRRVVSSGADQPYWDGLEEGRVLMQRCASCHGWRWPAVWRCGGCGSWDHDWLPIEPVGRVYAWTRTWHPFGGLDAVEKPFVSLVVSLDGAGDRRITGLLEGEESGLAIGASVSGRVADVTVMGRDLPSIRWSLTGRGGA